MKAYKTLIVCICSAFIFSACSSDSGTNPTSTNFLFKKGDYSVYQANALDDNNQPTGTSYRTSRTVLQTGVSIGGQTDAVMIADSSFQTTPASVSTSYYRVNNNEVFTYIDLTTANALAGGLGTVSNFTPTWVKLGELNESAGSSDFSTTISATLNIPQLGATPLSIKFTGRNKGAVNLTVNSQTYRVYQQSQTTSVSTTLVGQEIKIELPVDLYVGGIPNATNSPRTIVRTQTNSTKITLPLLGSQSIPGTISSLTSFREGTLFQ